jgi:predicted Kef-type K+ transport protein
MRRGVAWLALVGTLALLIAWPLWHAVRPDTSGCSSAKVPCDPREYLPFASAALALTVAGTVAIVGAAVWLGAVFLRAVLRQDAEDRRARNSRSSST